MAKRIISGAGVSLMLFLFTFTATAMAREMTSPEYIEEDADMVLPSDRIITGEMNKYSRSRIVVDDSGYSLCRRLKVFSERGEELTFEILADAEKVKIFYDKGLGCVRKVKVIRSAR